MIFLKYELLGYMMFLKYVLLGYMIFMKSSTFKHFADIADGMLFACVPMHPGGLG